MGGGSGLLSRIRGSSSKKDTNKKRSAKSTTKNDAGSAIQQAPSSPPPPSSSRGFPGGAGGVAITCGSFFRNSHARDVDDLYLHGGAGGAALQPLHGTDAMAAMAALTTTSSVATTTTTSSSAVEGSEAPPPTNGSSPTKAKKNQGPTPPYASSPQASVVSTNSMRTPGSGASGRTIRGKEVASKAALFESKSQQNTNNNSPVPPPDDASVASSSLSPPPSKSRRITTLKQQNFWSAVLKQTSSEDEEGDLVSLGSHDVKKKSEWLQSAFSPTGGGNMPGLEDEEESMTQDLTDTFHGDEDGSVSILSESIYTTNSSGHHNHNNNNNASHSSPSYYNYWAASNTPPRQKSPEAPPAMTDHDRVWRDAYQLWFRHGLLPWKPSDEEEEDEDKAALTTKGVGTPTTTTAVAEEREDGEEPEFHDSFMALDHEEEDDDRGAGRFGETPASPGSVQASRTLHRNLTQACPLLTVFGGGGANGNLLLPSLTTPPVTTTPKTLTKTLTKAPSSPPPPKSLTSPKSLSSSTPSSPIKLLPSLTPSPSQLYSNYVMAYTAYVQDRHNPNKAASHHEARRLLEMSRRQPL